MPFEFFMDRTLAKFVSLSMLLAGLLMPILGFGAQKPSPAKKTSRPPAMPVPQLPVPPPGPATPLSLEQIPAVAPQVSFTGGELTIIARNSSLGAILEQVQTQTGANIDMPGTPADRVVGQFGPGPPREVLAALLNGSHFNYVLLGSPQHPDSLYRVVLLAKSPGSEQPESQAAAGSPVLPQRAFAAPTQEADDMSADDNAQEMAEQNADDQAAEQNNGQPNSQPAIKTPQQLLQELQRQQQVQQQGPQGGPVRQPPSPQQQ